MPSARSSSWPSHLAMRAALVALSTVLALGLGEVILRLVSGNAYSIWPPHLHQELYPTPDIMPGVSGTSRFVVDSLGLRGDEPAAGREIHVLALGGSTTECLYLDQTEAWPHVLQDLLGPSVWVGNGGRSGLNTRHHRLQAEKLLDELPRIDLVIVLAGVNDLGLRLSQDTAWAPADFHSPAAVASFVQEAFSLYPPRFAAGPFFQRTVFHQALKKLRRVLRSGGATQDPPGRIYQVWRRHRQEAPLLRQRLPDLAPALAEYAENLRAIARAAARHRARIVFATQPSMWRDDLPPALQRLLWMGGLGRYQKEAGHEYYSIAALAEGMALYNRALLDTCRRIPGALCVDLAAQLPRDVTVMYDDVHFNEAGSRRVAEILAERLGTARETAVQSKKMPQSWRPIERRGNASWTGRTALGIVLPWTSTRCARSSRISTRRPSATPTSRSASWTPASGPCGAGCCSWGSRALCARPGTS